MKNIQNLYTNASDRRHVHAHIDLGDMVDKADPAAIKLVEDFFEREGLLTSSLYLLSNGNHDIPLTGGDLYADTPLKEHTMQPGTEYLISGENAVISIMTVQSYVGHAIEKELRAINDQQERLDAYHQACNKIILPQLKQALEGRSAHQILLLIHYPLFDPPKNTESLGNRRHLSSECLQVIDATLSDGKGPVMGVIHAHHHGGIGYSQTDLYGYTPGGILLFNASGRARRKINLPFVTKFHIDFQENYE